MTRDPKKMDKSFSTKITLHYSQIHFMWMFYKIIRKRPPKIILEDEFSLYDLMTVMTQLREQLIMIEKLYNPKTTNEFIENIDPETNMINKKYAEKIFK